jgi:hypothetical protein
VGWKGYEDFITTGFNIEPYTEVIMMRNFTFTHEGSFIQLLYTHDKDESDVSSKLLVELDGKIAYQVIHKNHNAESQRMYMPTLGTHQVRFIYENNNDNLYWKPNIFTIYKIMVYGTEEGGAASCEP